MNFQLVKTLFVGVVALIFCHGTKNFTKTNDRIFKVFLIQCPTNLNSHNIQVTVQLAVHSTNKTVNLFCVLSLSHSA